MMSRLRTVVIMKDAIERALSSALVSVLFTRTLLAIVMANIDGFAKAVAASMFGFITALVWWATLLAVKDVVNRKPPKDTEQLTGVKRIAMLSLFAAGGSAGIYILIRMAQQPTDPFEMVLYAYTVFVIWFIFALEAASTKIASRPSSQNNMPTP